MCKFVHALGGKLESDRQTGLFVFAILFSFVMREEKEGGGVELIIN